MTLWSLSNWMLFIDEIHLKKGTNEDLSLLNKWTPTYLEREFGMKNGGGKWS